jgi:hypothetical protein
MEFNTKEIFNILWNSFINAFKWSPFKWLATGSIGGLSGTLLFGEKFFELSLDKSLRYGIGVLIGLYILRFILIAVRDGLKYYHEVYKNSAYGDAIIDLNNIFSNIHLYRKTPGHQDEEFMKIMINLCNGLQKIFSTIIKEDCCVSVKVPVSGARLNEQAVLMNLTRDLKHTSRDNNAEYNNTQHTLIANSAFTIAFNKVVKNKSEKYYLNNKVNSTENYENTSKECYEDGVLPYNSELVYPITPMQATVKNNDCIGFLCVDTKKIGAFSTKYEVAILQGVSDGIYDLIFERNHFKSQNYE